MASHLLSRKSCKKVYTLCQLCDDDDGGADATVTVRADISTFPSHRSQSRYAYLTPACWAS